MVTLIRSAAVCLALSLPAVAAERPRDDSAERPNVVFFLVDDLGWTDLGCQGSSFYETPHVDALAASGLRFTDAYAASPVCSPTRASILTGKYPARLRTTDYFGGPQPDAVAKHRTRDKPLLPARYLDHLPLEEVTLAESLHEAGYRTGFFGKWHLGGKSFLPQDQGFDLNVGGDQRGHPGHPGYRGGHFAPYAVPIPDAEPGEHLTMRLASEAAAFIREHRDAPFLVYLSFYAVHAPIDGRPDLKAYYERRRKALGRDTQWGQDGASKVRLTQDHPEYAAMVHAVDEAVGRVLAEIDRLGLANDTIVVFFSDNGGLSTAEGHPTSNLPLRTGKGWMYEGGIREPCIIRWPGVTEPGGLCRTPIVSTDFYPTLLEACRLPLRPDQHVDGLSLVPLLRAQADSAPARREAVYWHYPHYGNQGGSPGAAVRAGDWKLIEWYEPGRTVELFNLADDLGEQHNRAADHPDITRRLTTMLHNWQHDINAVMPTPNPNATP